MVQIKKLYSFISICKIIFVLISGIFLTAGATITFAETIQGTVTGSDGTTPLQNIQVNPWIFDQTDSSWSWTHNDSATTDVNGNYSIGSLSSGTYRVEFRDNSGVYATEYYNNKLSLGSAEDILLNTGGQTVSGINASLDTASHIQGVVTAPDGTTPLQNVQVSARIWDPTNSSWSWVDGQLTTTDINGNYNIGGLPSGTYRVEFRDNSGLYAFKFYHNKLSLDSAEDIFLNTGQTASNINASLDTASHIQGVVTAPDGSTPLQNIQVNARIWDPTNSSWNWGGSATTDINGNYNIGGLPSGTYRVEFRDDSGLYAFEHYNNKLSLDSAEDITVNTGENKNLNNTSLDTASHIQGVVTTSEDTTPLQSIQVSAYIFDTNNSLWSWANSVATDINGNYNIGGLPSGTYRISFRDNSGQYVNEYHDNKYIWNSSDGILVNAAQTVSGINASLDRSSHIQGVVTAPDGSTPLQNIQVIAYVWNQTNYSWSWVNSVTTDANGNYNIGGLYSGTYRVEFKDNSGQYLNEYYNNKSSLDSAEDILLNTGQTVRGINASLDTASNIQGVVTASDGSTPLQNIEVIANKWDSTNSSWNWVGSATTDANGNYNIGSLLSGTYRVEFKDNSGQYLNEYYNNKSSLDSAEDILLNTGQTVSGINASLDTASNIQGVVTANDGSTPFQNIEVIARRWDSTNSLWNWVGSTTTDVNGNYNIGSLPSGTYRVEFKDASGQYLNEYYNNASSFDSADDILVNTGLTVSNINASLSQTQNFGSLTVNISPQDAVNEGALWRIDGGDWQTSGSTVDNLTVGNHNVDFYNLEGWTTPASQPVIIQDRQTTTITGLYSQTQPSAGSLTVSILPQDAVNEGALWRIDGGDWQTSGSTVDNLTVGNHNVDFYNLEGWTTPASEPVIIQDRQTTTITGLYSQTQPSAGSLTVSILPQDAVNAGALWRVNGGAWQTSGSTVQNLHHGDYTVEFYPILGWTTPPNQNVTIQDGQIATLTGTYTYLHLDTTPPLPPPPPINENVDDPTPLPEETKPNDADDIKDVKTDIENAENQSQAEDITNHLDNDVTFIQENMPDDENTTPPNELIHAINRTIDNVGAIIEQSFTLLKQGAIDIDQALKPLDLLKDIIDLGAATAKTGGAISIEKVAGSLEYVESTINEIISNNAASEQIKKGADNINNILGNIPDVMNAVLTTDDVIKMLGQIKGVTGAGVISSIKSNNDPSKTINTIGNIVSKGLQEASDASIITNAGKIIKSTTSIVNYSIDILQKSTNDDAIIKNTFDQLQDELTEIIGQTSSNIKDKPVKNRSLSNSFAATTKSSDISSLDDFSYLMDNVSLLTTSMIKAKAVIKSSLTGTMQSLSRETIKNILPAFIYRISTTRAANIERDSDIQKFLTNYPQLLNEVIKIASVNLTEGMVITKTDIEQIIADNQSLTAKEKERLINGLPQMPRFDQDIIQSGIDTLSLVDLLQKAVDTLFQQDPLFQGTKVELVSTKSIQLMVMLKNPAIGLNMPLYVQDARVVSSLIPQGLHILPEGTIVLVRNGIAGIITPAPLDAVDTLLSADSLLNLDTIFSSAKKEVSDAKVDNNGTLNLKFKDGSKFSGSFGYGTVKEGDGNFDAGTSIYIPQGIDPASEAYSVLVVYNDGSTQQLSPSVSALEQLVIVLDTLAAGSYSLDRTTGIFTVLGMPFKPSYLIEPITTNEQSWFRANKDQYGIAWETNDYNGDGAVDLNMWTADGKQVIYTVIQ